MVSKKKQFSLNWICFVGVIILFLVLECLENFMPQWKIPIIIVKGLTSAIPLGLAVYSTIKSPDFFNVGFATVLFVYFLGDVLIRINFVAGVVAFFIANLFMSLVFLRFGKFTWAQFVTYLLSLIISLVLLILFKEALTSFFYPVLIYAFIVLFMLVSSFGMRPMVKIGAIIFFVSDVLLGVGLAGFGNPVLSFVSLGLYYIAICILSNVVYKRSRTTTVISEN